MSDDVFKALQEQGKHIKQFQDALAAEYPDTKGVPIRMKTGAFKNDSGAEMIRIDLSSPHPSGMDG